MFNHLGNHTPEEDKEVLRGLSSKASGQGTTGVAIEVGSWVGETALVIAPYFDRLFCIDHLLGSKGDYTLDVADYYGPENLFRTFAENTNELFLKRIYLCVGRSDQWSRVWTQKADFIFIDADHRYEAVKLDVESWLPHLNGSGIICGHDYNHYFPGVKEAVSEVFGENHRVQNNVWWHDRG